MSWWGRYVGLPFGEGPGEVTCWSLIARVYRDELGVELPAYGEIDARDLVQVARTMGREQLGEPWRAVADPEALDVAIMRSGRGGRAICHVGVMTSASQILHVEAATSAVVVPTSHFSIRGRIAGFRRYAR